MGVNMRNSEGYYDPTAFEALRGHGHQGPDLGDPAVPHIQRRLQVFYDPAAVADDDSPP